jgi:hypothetical protein
MKEICADLAKEQEALDAVVADLDEQKAGISRIKFDI